MGISHFGLQLLTPYIESIDFEEYLLRDDFTTALSAGSVNGTDCEPGPGVRELTDTGAVVSISGGEIIYPGGRVSSVDPLLKFTPTFARANGLGIMWDVIPTSGVSFGTLSGDLIAFDPTSTRIRLQDNFINKLIVNGSWTPDTNYQTVVIAKSAGNLYFIRGGTEFPNWTFLYPSLVDATDPITAAFRSYDANNDGNASQVTVLQLGPPFNTDYGYATTRLAGNRSAGDTFTHAADCVIVCDIDSLPAAGQIEIIFRKQDANNYWQVTRVNTTGRVDLDEVVAGTPVQRGTSVAATSGEMVIQAFGTNIRVLTEGSTRFLYTSATNFQTETDGELLTLPAGAVVSDIVTYPYNPSGDALAQIARLIP